MRKTYLFMMTTLDGYFEGVNHDLNWHNVDNEFNDFAIKQLDETGLLVFGARTYQLMADFWPKDIALKIDSETAKRMNSMPKIVFSHSLKMAEWNNTELYRDKVADVIRAQKELPGKDIAIFGSSNLCLTLLKEKLLDELRIMVNPIVLGQGTLLFSGIEKPLKTKLINTRTFKSGNILLTYKPL